MAYNQLDIYHRAFRAYKKELDHYLKENSLRKAICRAPMSTELLEASRFRCTVKLDWIETIENALPFIEKAILEGRQFILQQGEVQPIEKARRVSRSSVEHLSKHSELITRLPAEDEDLLPEKIYVTENDSNFAVYENRFLYFLLVTLDGFVSDKYAKIIELWNKYESKLEISKNVFIGKRKLEFSLTLREESKNDENTAFDEGTNGILTRINDLSRNISALLQTGLMKEVSHAALIKPPITRTNVLKMDNNFKTAVELYDYLTAYNEDGYEVERLGDKFDSFTELMEADFAELIAQSSYLAYRYGGRLEDLLEERYQEENERIREEEEKAAKAALEAIKKRFANGEVSVEEYVKFLEERNASVESRLEKSAQLEQEVEETKQALYLATEANENLKNEANVLRDEIEKKEVIIAENEAKHKAELAETEQKYLGEISAQKAAFEKEISLLQDKLDEAEERHLATMAQLHGLRYKKGLIPETEDYSSKEMLLILEKEGQAFEKFFAAQWKKAKKQIKANTFKKGASQTDSADQNINTGKDGE